MNLYKYSLFTLIIFLSLSAFSQTRYWVAGSAANWSGDNWAATSGGAADGGGPPTALQSAQFDGNGLGNCTIDLADPSIIGLVLNGYTGTIDLNGNTVTATGTVTLSSGTINDTPGTDSLVINSTGTTTFNGTIFGAIVHATSRSVALSGSTFNARSTFIKNGTGNITGAGGNTFNGDVILTHSGANNFILANTNPDDFNGSLTINNSGTGIIYLSHASTGNTYDGNIELNSTGTSPGIYFGNSGGTSTLAATYTFNIGSSGFSIGTLRLRGITQSGATAQSLTLTGTTSILDIYDSDFGGDVTFVSPRITTRGTTYQGTASLTKNGASNDQSVGGNRFNANATFIHAGSNQFLLGNTTPDTFDIDLSITNSGTGSFYLGNNSANNVVSGNLTAANTASGGTTDIFLSNNTASTLSITGNVTLTNTTSASNGRIYLGSNGDVTIGGDLSITNSATGAAANIYVANGSTSLVSVTGNTTVSNTSTNTTSRVYLGATGDVIFTGTLGITNSSTATNSQVYLNNGTTSSNTYNDNITIESTSASNDGVLFGNGGGSSTLAATKTIAIGGGGFLGGALYIRNFTQIGATAQTLTPSGTATNFTINNCNWGGDVVFSSARITTTGTTYSGTASLTKTGASDDRSVGGNTFTGNATLTLTGSREFSMGNGSPDTFSADLTLVNNGTYHMHIAYNSAGNTVAGNLMATNSATGTGHIYFSNNINSTLSVTGTTTLTNDASGTTNNFYLGGAGDITLNSSLTITNSPSGTTGNTYVANADGSVVTIAANTTVTNNGTGTTSRVYLGEQGDITFNGTLSITNSSNATNSQVYFNNNANSVNLYNENITLEVTNANCDGILFGNSNGSGTLAATKTISIGGGGFIGAGALMLRNFTQTGATAQALAITGTNLMTLYDCNWGGDVVFSSPRIITRGTTYSGTASLTKTGATDDQSVGGNTFSGNATLTNTGSNYFMMGNGTADTFNGDLDIINSGTDEFYLAQNSAGNTIAGNLTVTNSGTGANVVNLSNGSASTLTVTGTAVITNSGTGTTSNVYVGNAGDITFSSSLTLTNSSSATTGQIFLADDATSIASVTGDLIATNSGAGGTKRVYIGNAGPASLGGNVTLSNSNTATTGELYVGNGAGSIVTITGNTTLDNDGAGTTRRAWLGNAGDVTFGGTLDITNNSTATNSQVYLHDDPSSVNAYNGDITIVSGNSSNDGIHFGAAAGSGTLAATRTISIGGGGFLGNPLYIRNFTQVGATAQTLTPSGTVTYMTIYDCNWGGDVTFSSARILTRGTTYSGTASLSKTGASDDVSPGGNIFTGNAILNNSGSGYFMMGSSTADTFGGDLDITNSGTRHFYLARGSAGNTVAGNLTATNSGTGTSHIYIAEQSASSLTVTGTATFTNSASGVSSIIYVGDAGDVTFGSDLTLTNSASSTTGIIYLADEATSTISVTGNTIATNSGSGTTTNMLLGDAGPVTFSGDLTMSNSNTATTGDLYLGNGAAAIISITGNTSLLNDGVGTNRRSWLGNAGDVSFGGTLSITNNSSATNSQVYLQDDASSVNTYSGNITLESTEANSDGVYFGNSTGAGTLAATRTISIGGSGFLAQNLYLRNFTQVGATAQTLQPGGTITYLTIYDCNWGGDIVFSSAQFVTRGTTYSGTASLTKNGATDNISEGGNAFTGNTILNNSGSGYFLMGRTTADTFGGDLDLNLTGSDHMYLAYGSAGNTVAGNFTATNSGTGISYIFLADQSASDLTISGTAVITNSASGTTNHIYIGNAGDVTLNSSLDITNSATSVDAQVYLADDATSTVSVTGNTTATASGAGVTKRIYMGNGGPVSFGGDLTLDNSNTATTGEIRLANGAASIITIAGNTTVTNDGIGTTRRTYLGNAGDVTFGGTLSITNNSSATNSEVFSHYAASSVNSYTGNITVESTNTSCDGIYFGSNTGSGTLSATRTISIGGSGFIANNLYIRNFSQIGATAQTLHPTGASTLTTIYDCSWGGDIDFSSARMLSRGTTYSLTASLEKTGATDDISQGGNTFVGNATLINSGSGYWRFGDGTLDSFNANLDIINSGSRHFYFAYNGTGHLVSGDLTVTNSGTGVSYVYIADRSTSALTVTGSSTFTNSGSGSDTRMYIGSSGDITFNNDLSITNSASGTSGLIYVASATTSSLSVVGNTTVTNSGANTTKRVFLGNNGDITFTGTVAISNSSSATNSQVYCNDEDASNNIYNSNITVESTNANCDGVLFGSRGGSSTLAATRTITIGGGGFIAGNLSLINFTQIGATAQALHPTGTSIMLVDDSNWGGDVNFSSPRLDVEGSTFSGTASLDKTGSGNDRSAGGNTFDGNTTIINSGSGYWRFGEGTTDAFNANLDLVNSGTSQLLFAYSGAGHLISGDLTGTNSGTGTSYLYVGNSANSTLTVNGNATFTNSGSGSDVRTYVGNSGDITFNGDLTLTNSASGTTGLIYLANATSSEISVVGNTTVTNSGASTTRRVFVGNNGDITFTGTLDITNSSTATNSQVYCNYEDNSTNTYNGNITIESTSASNDGVLFGNSGGAGVLAATRTITIGGGGFIGSALYFRDFTQTGATAQTLAPTGITTFTLYDCNWGGDVTFSSARITSRNCIYSSTASLEKNGASNDDSYGQNTFNDNATFIHSGTGRWRLSSSVGDDFNGNVSYIRTGSGTFEPARQGTSTFAGDISFNFNTLITFAAGNGFVEMDGTTAQSINDLAASTEPRFRRLVLNNSNNEITLNTPISISTSMTFTQGNIITTDANLLTVIDEATVSGASDASYVRGPIEKIGEDDFIFPVGDSGFYRPITISGGSGKNNTTAFRATYYEVNPDSAGWTRSSLEGTIDHVSANEYWILDRTSGTATSNVTLSWDSNSGTVDNLGELRVARWNSATSEWADQGNGGTTGNTSEGSIVSNSAISSFSPFTLSSTTANNPLPVELVSFDAELVDHKVELTWETSSEINNDYYTVERSLDGRFFEEVNRVMGAGNSFVRRVYEATDFKPLQGISYYRLKQTDYDGTQKIYPTVVIKNNNQAFSFYPNPVVGNIINIKLKANQILEGGVSISLVDKYGKELIREEIIMLENEQNLFQLHLSDNFPSGVYTLVIRSTSERFSKPIIIY